VAKEQQVDEHDLFATQRRFSGDPRVGAVLSLGVGQLDQLLWCGVLLRSYVRRRLSDRRGFCQLS